jgi:hypothetical protein
MCWAPVEAYTVVVHPKDPETVFAGTNDGVWRSTDRGATFRRTGFPDAKTQVWCFMVDSRDPKRIFAGASPIDVYRSDDGGANWKKLKTPVIGTHCKGPFASRVMRLAQNPKKPDEIYACAGDQRRDAQHRRRRDLAGLQRGADQALRAAASQEQDRERYHGRGACSTAMP